MLTVGRVLSLCIAATGGAIAVTKAIFNTIEAIDEAEKEIDRWKETHDGKEPSKFEKAKTVVKKVSKKAGDDIYVAVSWLAVWFGNAAMTGLKDRYKRETKLLRNWIREADKRLIRGAESSITLAKEQEEGPIRDIYTGMAIGYIDSAEVLNGKRI